MQKLYFLSNIYILNNLLFLKYRNNKSFWDINPRFNNGFRGTPMT